MTWKAVIVTTSLAILGATSAATAQTPDEALQVVPLVESPGQSSVIFGGPYMNTGLIQLLRSHTSHSDWRTSDNMLFPRTFVYDALHKRLIGPGLQLGDVNNPANLRLGRIPTNDKDEPDVTKRHTAGTIIGQICSMGWGPKGFTACQAGLQFVTFDETTGGVCISLVTGRDGSTPPYPPSWPNGVPFSKQDMVCHVLVNSDGTVIVGLNTDPRQRPRFSLVVNGNGELNGNVVINGNLTVTGEIRAGSVVTDKDSKSTK
jgi:hypothetical protein